MILSGQFFSLVKRSLAKAARRLKGKKKEREREREQLPDKACLCTIVRNGKWQPEWVRLNGKSQISSVTETYC